MGQNQALQKMSFGDLQSQLAKTTDSNSISVFRGELTKAELVRQSKRLFAAFPKINKGFLEVLKDRFASNGFTDERMIAAVDFVIDNYVGWDKLPAIADFIQFDRKVRVYSWAESVQQGQSNFVCIDVGNKPKWILQQDFEKYKIFKKWESRKYRPKIV